MAFHERFKYFCTIKSKNGNSLQPILVAIMYHLSRGLSQQGVILDALGGPFSRRSGPGPQASLDTLPA